MNTTPENYWIVDPQSKNPGEHINVRDATDEQLTRAIGDVEKACQANRDSIDKIMHVNANNYATIGLLKYELDRRTRTLRLATLTDISKLRSHN